MQIFTSGDDAPLTGGGPAQPADADLGLRARKKQATARALHQTAVDLVASAGLDGVTVDQICDVVGVSSRTFFNYYASKEAAVTASVPTPPPDADLVEFEAGGPTGALLADLGTAVSSHLGRHAMSVADLAAQHRMLHREPRLVGRWRSAIHTIEQRFGAAIATREGREADDLGVVLLAAIASSGIRTAMQRWVAAGGTPGIEAHVADVFARLDAGIDSSSILTASSTAIPTDNET